MSSVIPVVRHMILCDEVRPDPDHPNKVDIFGLISRIHAVGQPLFPLHHPELCVYLQVSGGRGSSTGRIVAVHADTEEIAFATPEHRLGFGNDPLEILGIVFRIRDCVFPQPGLYWIQLRLDGETIAQQPLLVR